MTVRRTRLWPISIVLLVVVSALLMWRFGAWATFSGIGAIRCSYAALTLFLFAAFAHRALQIAIAVAICGTLGFAVHPSVAPAFLSWYLGAWQVALLAVPLWLLSWITAFDPSLGWRRLLWSGVAGFVGATCISTWAVHFVLSAIIVGSLVRPPYYALIENVVRKSSLAWLPLLFLGWLTGCLVAAKFGITFVSNTGGIADSPLAWVDRNGYLASHLDRFPSELLAGTGTAYVGWTTICFCLLAVWPSRHLNKRGAFVIVAALALLWLSRNIDLHSQWKNFFEFATIRRFVAIADQQWGGVVFVAILTLSLTFALAVAAVVRGSTKIHFWNLMIILIALMGWWSLGAGTVMSESLRRQFPAHGHEFIIGSFLCLGAACGTQRIYDKCRSTLERGFVLTGITALICSDSWPYLIASFNVVQTSATQLSP